MTISGPEVAQNLGIADDNDTQRVDVRGEDDDERDQFVVLLAAPVWHTVQLVLANVLLVVHGERYGYEERNCEEKDKNRNEINFTVYEIRPYVYQKPAKAK
jgi:hypothetical protein